MMMTLKMTVFALVCLVSVQAWAQLECQIGLLDLAANDGINPTTGMPWKAGDSYRFAFITSPDGDGFPSSPDIQTYNADVQALADASPLGIGSARGAVWRVIGSTATVDARVNTATHPGVNGTGETIFLLDGATVVAVNYADLWSGSIRNIINITERAGTRTGWPHTGTRLDGTKRDGSGGDRHPFGTGNPVGQGNSSDPALWVWREHTSSINTHPYYAISDPLTIRVSGAVGPQLAIHRDNGPDGGLRLAWESRVAMAYTVRTATDLSMPPADWEVLEEAILATPPENLLLVEEDGPQRFFILEESAAPVLFQENFMSGPGGFTVSTTGGTGWEFGTPASPDRGGGGVLSAAVGDACWGTDLTGGYFPGTDTALRSPVVDLTGVGSAALRFSLSFDGKRGHTLEVNVIGPDSDAVIVNLVPAFEDADRTESRWEIHGPFPLPEEALGGPVRFEWRFVGDGDFFYNGAYIDAVSLIGG